MGVEGSEAIIVFIYTRSHNYSLFNSRIKLNLPHRIRLDEIILVTMKMDTPIPRKMDRKTVIKSD